MTEKQKIFATYLLNKIGISESIYIEKYLKYLEVIYGRWCWTKRDRYGCYSKWYDASDCIKCLLDEIELKKNRNEIKEKDVSGPVIFATDLANYRYCPIAFSIHKSFIIEKINGVEATNIGTTLHEELRLVTKFSDIKSTRSISDESTYDNHILKKIVSAELIFCGHSENRHKFENSEVGYSGIPDYIFKDYEGQYFVVEEKFHKKSDYNRLLDYHFLYQDDLDPILSDRLAKATKWADSAVSFYPNHELQLLSYIRNIKEFKIGYGYLIYWYYDLKGGIDPYIHRVEIKKYEMDSFHQNQYNTYMSELTELIKTGKQRFDKGKLYPNKCAACVVSKYCMHKTGKYEELHFPYKKNDLSLYYVDFPEKLKKEPKEK